MCGPPAGMAQSLKARMLEFEPPETLRRLDETEQVRCMLGRAGLGCIDVRPRCSRMDRGGELFSGSAGANAVGAGGQDRSHGSLFLRLSGLQYFSADHAQAEAADAGKRGGGLSTRGLQSRGGLADVPIGVHNRAAPWRGPTNA